MEPLLLLELCVFPTVATKVARLKRSRIAMSPCRIEISRVQRLVKMNRDEDGGDTQQAHGWDEGQEAACCGDMLEVESDASVKNRRGF